MIFKNIRVAHRWGWKFRDNLRSSAIVLPGSPGLNFLTGGRSDPGINSGREQSLCGPDDLPEQRFPMQFRS
jgi:hypothetical protein